MNINIETTGITLTPSMRSAVEEKLTALEKFFPDDTSIDVKVELGKPSQHHKKGEVFYAETNLNIPGVFWRASATDEDIYVAINEATDDLKKQVVKWKEKRVDEQRRAPEL